MFGVGKTRFFRYRSDPLGKQRIFFTSNKRAPQQLWLDQRKRSNEFRKRFKISRLFPAQAFSQHDAHVVRIGG
jgi:hypothetical protein